MRFRATSLVLVTRVLLGDSISPHFAGGHGQGFYSVATSVREGSGWKSFRARLEGTEAEAKLDFVRADLEFRCTWEDYLDAFSGSFDEVTKRHDVAVRFSPSGFEFRAEARHVEHSEAFHPGRVGVPLGPESDFVRGTPDGFVVTRLGNTEELRVPKREGLVEGASSFLCGSEGLGARSFAYVSTLQALNTWELVVSVNDSELEMFYTIDHSVDRGVVVPPAVFNETLSWLMRQGFSHEVYSHPGLVDMQLVEVTKSPCYDYEEIVANLPPVTLNLQNGIDITISPDELLPYDGEAPVPICRLAMAPHNEAWNPTRRYRIHESVLLRPGESIHFTKDGHLGFCQL